MRLIQIVFLSVILTSCAFLDHRDYEEKMLDQYADPLFIPTKDFPVIAGDTGVQYFTDEELVSRTPASMADREQNQYSSSLKGELSLLEARLSPPDMDNYLKVKNKLGSISSQIYFLRLHPNERLPYLAARNIELDGRIAEMRRRDEPLVGLGMDKSTVISSWGQPLRREFSGDPMEQNERWSYHKAGKVKYLYFEDGRIGGWSE